MKLGRLAKALPVWPLLAPGYPDTARLAAQGKVFRRLLRDRPFAGKCLNAGCGEGLFNPLLESFPGVTRIDNVDLTDPARVADRFPDPRHRFAQGSLTELPFPDAEFDCCLCTEVIEHVPEQAKAAAELARVVRPGGTLLASVPQTPAPWDPAHVVQGYTFDEFRGLLGGAGFDVVSRADCFYGLMRAVMWYWRKPLVRFGAERCPYLPRPAVAAAGHLDAVLPLGRPWDLVVLAVRR